MPYGRIIGFVLLISAALPRICAQTYAEILPVDHAAIRYSETSLNQTLAGLKFEPSSDSLGHLATLLKALGVSPDSQALVFSKTSVQAANVSPTNPRAIYFNDRFAVGYVPGSKEIEIASLHPKQGVVFYTLDLRLLTVHRADGCLACHQGPATLGVPGMFIGSVYPNADGVPAPGGAIITDHRTPFRDRWGGWYVNAAHGEQPDRANSVAPDPSEPETLDSEGRQNVVKLTGKFNSASYLSPVSDIVALMTFEHQTQMGNFITRLGWKARISPGASQAHEIDSVVAYLLFANEAPLPAPIEGVSTFAKTFAAGGPRDHMGRSLRDFDLTTRLFRYPLSYMIYSPAFDALPESVREQVYRRLYEALTGHNKSGLLPDMSSADKSNILEILRETKLGLPAYWSDLKN